MQNKPLPPFGPYTIEEAMVPILGDFIAAHRPARSLELGSGLSTIVLGYAIKEAGGRLDSLENEKKHAEQARGWVAEHALDDVATIHDAPIRNALVHWDGMAYPWYDLSVVPPGPYDFVFVDGPAGNLGLMARWPAYYHLLPFLSEDARLICDDGKRGHERLAIYHWMKNDSRLHRTDLPTQRGAVLLERRAYARTKGERPSPADPHEAHNRQQVGVHGV